MEQDSKRREFIKTSTKIVGVSLLANTALFAESKNAQSTQISKNTKEKHGISNIKHPQWWRKNANFGLWRLSNRAKRGSKMRRGCAKCGLSQH
ncbi:hypothetical protein HFN_2136 [Helicobacter fennelliae MRY12-0050]|uniref:Uncharacterized protein n=1 Tax=Helicobacter fennelliae MRY12-0050 TaxID=1325130 RepID=T1CPN9_9HELI|nr:hypothetical protein HFN_2136 [Helicobacter fennelliae MRY12-0050]